MREIIQLTQPMYKQPKTMIMFGYLTVANNKAYTLSIILQANSISLYVSERYLQWNNNPTVGVVSKQ